MKIIKYLISIVMISSILQLAILPITVEAVDWKEAFGYGSDWIQKGKENLKDDEGNIVTGKDGNPIPDVLDEGKIQSTASTVFNALLTFGMVLSVIIGGILGIQFMMASADDKAKIKEALVPYVIGCIAIFGAYGIWKLVVGILNNL